MKQTIELKVLVVFSALGFALVGCDAITGDSGGGGGGPSSLDGTWAGRAEEITSESTGTGSENSARSGGLKIVDGEVTEILEMGTWTAFSPAVPINTTADASIFTIAGADIPETTPVTDKTIFIVVNSTTTHIGLFEIQTDVTATERFIDIAAYRKIEEVAGGGGAPEFPPTITAADLAGNWSGTSFDATAASPPALNLPMADTMTLGDGGSMLDVTSGGIMGMDQAAAFQSVFPDSSPTGTDKTFGVFWEPGESPQLYGYAMWLIPSTDLGAIAVCFDSTGVTTGATVCGDGQSSAFTLDSVANGGWGFSLMTPVVP